MEAIDVDQIKETEMKEIKGIGLIIIHAHTGQILAITEQLDDPRTARKKGQLSIPLETRKEYESAGDNAIAAMAEVVDDVDQYGHDFSFYLRNCFFRTSDDFISPGFSVIVNKRAIRCDLAVFIYDGPDIRFKPFSNGETADVRWVSPLDFARDDTRLFAQLAITELLWQNIYRKNMFNYRNFPQLRVPVFDEYFSIRETYMRREQLPDMK